MDAVVDDGKLVLAEFLPYRLSIVSHMVGHAVAQAYERRFALTIPQWRVIALLSENEAMMPIDIAEEARMDKMTVSRAAAVLVHRGLVARAPNPGDRRSQILSLTRQGHALYAEVSPEALRLERRLLEECGKGEVAEFVAMLDRLERAAAAMLEHD